MTSGKQEAVLAWSVIIPLPIPACDFAVPHGYTDKINVLTGCRVPIGCRVLVPWRGELVVGLVVGTGTMRGLHRMREAVYLLDAVPWVSPAAALGIMAWATDARMPAGLIWNDLLGIGWQSSYRHWVKAVAGTDLTMFSQHIPSQDWAKASDFSAPLLDAIREQGLLEERFEPLPKLKNVIQARPLEDVPLASRVVMQLQATGSESLKLTPKQAQACAWLREHGPIESLSLWAKGAKVSAGVITAALNAGGAEYVSQVAAPPHAWEWLKLYGPADTLTSWASQASADEVPLSPTAAGTLVLKGWAEQIQIVAPLPMLPAAEPALAIPFDAPDTLPEAEVWRLHGGRAASRFKALSVRLARLLMQGRGVMVIAPDYATLRRAWAGLSGLAAALDTVAVQVSGQLNEAQREHTWNLICSGAARLVIGSAHALTAPVHDLALLVVLEEASDAYKMLSGSRAFIPDIAARIAKASGAALVYAGTTPALESVLQVGVILPPPKARIHVVDYANPPEQPELGPLSGIHLSPNDLGYPLSHDLARLLRQVQQRGRQAVLLAPRRGYSALLRCPSCDHVPQCKNCDISLRFHQTTRQLTCHQCGYHENVPERCNNCGERMWKAKGPGTEWIAAEVAKLLPKFPVYRLDKDQQDDLTPLMNGEAGVVVGTQMLLSHEAPPNLALVGITLADTWLNVSDFRASERYHRLLRQLVEWHPSKAPMLVVQTFQAEHPALKALIEGRDTLAYPAAEEHIRKELGYPPHAHLAQIELTAREAKRAEAAAEELASALHGAGATLQEVLGPAPSVVARLRGMYPYHLLLRARSETRLAELLKVLDSRTWKARIRVDVNPRGGL